MTCERPHLGIRFSVSTYCCQHFRAPLASSAQRPCLPRSLTEPSLLSTQGSGHLYLRTLRAAAESYLAFSYLLSVQLPPDCGPHGQSPEPGPVLASSRSQKHLCGIEGQTQRDGREASRVWG